MGRLMLGDGATADTVRAALAEAGRDGFRHLMTRLSPKAVERIEWLRRAGFSLMDTLVTLELPLNGRTVPPEPARTAYAQTVRHAAPGDQTPLMAIAREAFADRTIWLDRFHADPGLRANGRADELYAQWIANSVAPPSAPESMADQVLVTVSDRGALTGFITCQRHADGHGIVPLNAVERAARGHGVYRVLVHHALRWFREQQVPRLTVRTSVTSLAVQRTWIRFGALPMATEHTFHWWHSDGRSP